MKFRADGLLGLHGAVLLFALSGIIGKDLVLAPAIIVAGRSAFAAMTLLMLIAVQGRLGQIPRSGVMVVSGAVLALHWLTFFQAIDCAGVGVALVSYSTYPLALMLMEACWYRIVPSVRRVVAGVLILVGMVLLVPELNVSNHVVVGAFWGIGSGALFALYTLFNRGLSRSAEPIAIAGGQNAVSALCLLPFVIWLTATTEVGVGLRELVLLGLLGVVCTGLAHTWFISSLAAVGAGTASLIASLEAVHGVVLAWLLLGEVPEWRTVVGGIIILSAVVLGTREPKRFVQENGVVATAPPSAGPLSAGPRGE